jgi:opacity protein-like surface antigen
MGVRRRGPSGERAIVAGEVTLRATVTIGRRHLSFLLMTLAIGVSPSESVAQGFISPSVGYNFGGDSGCLAVTDCEDRNWNLGIAVGALGGLAGFEFELMYDDAFFGETEDRSSRLLTMMGNFMLAPKFGPVQPYGLVGMGVIRTSVEIAGDAVEEESSDVGWDIGGGVIVFFGQHVGVRGDIRYYHSFQVLDLFGLDLPFEDGEKLDFGRASVAVVFKF